MQEDDFSEIAWSMEINYSLPYIVRYMKNNPLNCWEPLKVTEPQRRDEIYSSATVTKVEKICYIAQG